MRSHVLLSLWQAVYSQSEGFIPVRSQCLVLGVGLEPFVAQLQHTEGIALASNICRCKPLCLDHCNPIQTLTASAGFNLYSFAEMEKMKSRFVRDHCSSSASAESRLKKKKCISTASGMKCNCGLIITFIIAHLVTHPSTTNNISNNNHCLLKFCFFIYKFITKSHFNDFLK